MDQNEKFDKELDELLRASDRRGLLIFCGFLGATLMYVVLLTLLFVGLNP